MRALEIVSFRMLISTVSQRDQPRFNASRCRLEEFCRCDQSVIERSAPLTTHRRVPVSATQRIWCRVEYLDFVVKRHHSNLQGHV